MTDTEKVAAIRRILSILTVNINDDDDGDKYLSHPMEAIEAIEAVVDDDTDSPIFKMFAQYAAGTGRHV